MRTSPYPAFGYSGQPDWNDLLYDFGPSLFFDGVPLAEVRSRAAGQLALLAVPFGGLTYVRQKISVKAAQDWRVQLLPYLTSICPAIDADAALRMPRPAPEPWAVSPEDWQALCAQYFHLSGPVIIPPVPGWEDSRELFQLAGTALCALRPVYVIRQGG